MRFNIPGSLGALADRNYSLFSLRYSRQVHPDLLRRYERICLSSQGAAGGIYFRPLKAPSYCRGIVIAVMILDKWRGAGIPYREVRKPAIYRRRMSLESEDRFVIPYLSIEDRWRESSPSPPGLFHSKKPENKFSHLCI